VFPTIATAHGHYFPKQHQPTNRFASTLQTQLTAKYKLNFHTSFPSSSKIKNEWSCISTPPRLHIFHGVLRQDPYHLFSALIT